MTVACYVLFLWYGVKSVASPVCPLIAAAVVEWFAVPHAVVFEHDAVLATALFGSGVQ